MSKPKTITIDDVEYVRADSARVPVTGTRKIVVLDRGWIMVGNASTKDGVTTLTGCSNVRQWSKGGFGGLTLSREESGAVLDPCGDVKFSEGSEILSVPVREDW